MSDLAAAAAALGIPEPIAERSARARATATGQSYEEILAAWAGGQAVAPAAPAEAPPEPSAEAAEAPAEAAEPEQAATPATPAAPSPAPTSAPAAVTPAAVGAPPILEGPAERPLVWAVGGVGVLVLTLLLGFIFPSLPETNNEVRSSHFDLSEAALDGQVAYLRAGCASCHTQVVRSVVADVGVGPVALADTNQVPGFRRLGPDLSNAGGHLNAEQLGAAITGSSHPALPLSDSALSAVVAYLSETASPPSGGES